MSSNDNYTAIMLEEIRDQNRAVLEAVGQMQNQMVSVATKSDLQEVAKGVVTIKSAVTATNHDLLSLDARVTALEQH